MMNETMLAELRDRPVFICGHPKAGTSLVRAVLDCHPQLVVYPEETGFFRRYLPAAAGQDLEGQLALAERLLIHIFRWNREHPPADQAGFPDRDYSAIPYEEVRQAMRLFLTEDRPRHSGDLLSAAVLAFGQASGHLGPQTTAWVEKSPYNEYYAGQIFAWWPEARCIHVVRDPRDNFVSYRRKHTGWQPEFFAGNWLRSTRAGLRNAAQYGARRYWLLRYEDLVSAPQETLEQMVAFSGIEWSETLARPTRSGQSWKGNSMFASQFEGISSAPTGRWREGLPAHETMLIELMTRPLLEQLDYPVTTRPTLGARLQAASWPMRRRISRLAGGKKSKLDVE